ncbi:hypothetical protein [Fibrobacter sp. UWR2]|uniref:hypothetical protein n=1 Tax=Fibrobacter sp. UWR2 TaxID=1964352 RepID=UPI000B520279|nr:hypothetical protein [Fibrobacter sp. UWR2]OWU99892.1 hypothetical protein B7994_09460 [Fibrobacter sp. UWR2]
MMNNKKTTLIFATALMFSATAAFAEADSSVVTKQTSFLQKLDSLNKSILGLRLGGTAKAGALTSMATSDQFLDNSATQENQAFTDVNLKFLAQPSSETRLDVQVRLHKDWQSGVDENNNPVIGHWFSYDGKILNNHVDFNLGYMRVGYTPLTINTPQVEILQEPEIFAQNRVEALSYRNLDTTSRRLMQGLNAEFHSGNVGALDDIYAQATGARLRNTAKKNDQVFFDFDWADRYAYGLRTGLSAFGANLGANFVGALDRRLTTRSRDLGLKDTIFYDNNSVLSVELGFNSKKLLPHLPVNFGLNGEYAMSWWEVDAEYMDTDPSFDTQIKEAPVPDGDVMTSIVYVSSTVNAKDAERTTVDLMDDKGTALNVRPFVEGSVAGVNFKVDGMYLMNDKEFWSDLASSPNYMNNGIIFNANALYGDADQEVAKNFASGNLENLYFMVYNTDLLTAATLMSSGTKTVLSGSSEAVELYYRLYNNYKLAHFYRNAYDANTMKKLEAAQALLLMDPSVNLAMPYGLATPDRKGFAASIDADWNDAVEVNVRFSQYTAEASDNKYTTIGAGLGVDVGRLVPSLDRKIKVSGSFEKATEDSYLQRSSQRIVGGFSADIWGPIALEFGAQMLNKKFEGNVFGIAGLPVGMSFIQKVDEMLILAGPRVRIAPESYITVRYGMLKNTVGYKTPNAAAALDATLPPYVDKELSVDKNIISADVTVNF